METLTRSHPRSFLCRGMSYTFDSGVGSRYSNRSYRPTPVVARADFAPTTFEQDGTSSDRQGSRSDPTASTVITPSQIAPSGSRGRSETAFYRPQHQPATVSASVVLDTFEHQYQSLQASPRGSPQVLPIRSLAQVGHSGGLPSVRQVSIRHVFWTLDFGFLRIN